MKKALALLLALVMVLSLAACSPSEPAVSETPNTEEEGKVFRIYAWNEEFKGFFEKYYAGTVPISGGDTEDTSDDVYFDKAPGIPEGVTVEWVINPSDGGVYQDKLDEALLNQANASDDEKIDLFLAEADYILKYTNSEYTQDITALGVTDFSNTYEYTVQAASDSNGVVKGVSFQCCPSAMIYRRSIAEDVLGTSDPAEVQALMDSWEKFDAVAAEAKAKGYYITSSEAETFRVFSNNTTAPLVNEAGELVLDESVENWKVQALSLTHISPFPRRG